MRFLPSVEMTEWIKVKPYPATAWILSSYANSFVEGGKTKNDEEGRTDPNAHNAQTRVQPSGLGDP
jgi:hypothetical protein